MPFRSRAQEAKFHFMEERGEIPKGTTHEWAEATPGGVKSLPNRVGKKPASRHKATRGRRALSSHYTPKV